jgi:hypothetical protein
MKNSFLIFLARWFKETFAFGMQCLLATVGGWEENKKNYASLTWLGSRCPFWFLVRRKEATADAKLGCRFLISESNPNFVATTPTCCY